MAFKTFLLKYGEIGIKGKNRGSFEDALVEQVEHALSRVNGSFTVSKEQGRIYVDVDGGDNRFDQDEIISALKKVFGLVGICPAIRTKLGTPEEIAAGVVQFIAHLYGLEFSNAAKNEKGSLKRYMSGAPFFEGKEAATFKIYTRRANKEYPFNSMQVDALVGEKVLEAFPGRLKVDVHDPDIMVHIELRKEVFIYSQSISGPGGMPVGTNGKAELLLSGGIDSPVAGWMVSKRGVRLCATYFHAPPYTSERAKQKVIDLAEIVTKYSGPIILHIVNFTQIQLAIYDRCPHDELTIIMRRYMMRIAEAFARQDGAQALITGESIGQVASQTIQSLMCTDEAVDMMVFRPLIGFDKQDIINVALRIGTYNTSIQPYEDCCTIFVAKHPVTKPHLDVIQRSERRLGDEIGEMVLNAIGGAQTMIVK